MTGRAIPTALASCLLLAAGSGCASSECNFNSQCGPRHYCTRGMCRQDCRLDTDCPGGLACSPVGRCELEPDGGFPEPDAGRPGADAGRPGTDAGRPGADAGRPGADAGRPGADAGRPMGTRRYLDRCTSAGDCASGECVDDVGASRFCTRSCAAHDECADEHLCADGLCHHDDTGRPCSTSTPETCALGLCLGVPGGLAACTRDCRDASDCPAGYACTTAGGGSARICVDVEKTCTEGGSECATGLCLGVGCTASCRTAADCPRRLPGFEPYACRTLAGVSGTVCVPPADVLGGDPIGATCRADPGTGGYLCRSRLCDESAPTGAMCTQSCTAEGGCGPAFGCFPLVDGGDVLLVCERAGAAALGQPCTSGRDCDSGLCDTANYCTRLCQDGLCPTGWTCMPVGLGGINICRRP